MWRKIISILTTAIVLQYIPNGVSSTNLEILTELTETFGSILKTAASAGNAIKSASETTSGNAESLTDGSLTGGSFTGGSLTSESFTGGASDPLSKTSEILTSLGSTNANPLTTLLGSSGTLTGGPRAIPIQITGIMTTMTGDPLGMMTSSVSGLSKETERVESSRSELNDPLSKVKEILSSLNMETARSNGATDSSTEKPAATEKDFSDTFKTQIEEVKVLADIASKLISRTSEADTPSTGQVKVDDSASDAKATDVVSKTSETITGLTGGSNEGLRLITEGIKLLSSSAGKPSGTGDLASTVTVLDLTKSSPEPVISIVGVAGGVEAESSKSIPLGTLANFGELLLG